MNCQQSLALIDIVGIFVVVFCAVFFVFLYYHSKKSPKILPPIEIMEQRERDFLAWLTVLYKDNPSIVPVLFDEVTDNLVDADRIGEDEPYDTLPSLYGILWDYTHFSMVSYWDMDWGKANYAEWLEPISAMWQRFGFEPDWSQYHEHEFYNKDDELGGIEPLFRWLQHQFLANGAVLFAWEDFDGFWFCAVVPIADKDEFIQISKQWGLFDCFE